MSVQSVSRFLAILALDEAKLRQFFPTNLQQDGTFSDEPDENEEQRNALVEAFEDLTAEERDLFRDADMTMIFRLLAAADRPAPDPPIGG